ncbi:uncharacterized protein LOC131162430 isoform X2 [Malania oleifera]|nr:uncharacterized protein LOC131162430 isoform X2 [Malania oleifera]
MIPAAASYGGLEFPGSVRINHHRQHPYSHHQQQQTQPRQSATTHPPMHEAFPLAMGSMQDFEQQTITMANNKRGERERGKHLMSDDEELSFVEDAVTDGHNEVSRSKKGLGSPWHRVKWTDKMVRLLVTAVSYIGEDAASDFGVGGRRKCVVLQKKGKWKSISKVMAEREFFVSPQQCEDKFNDLNKRYKRLNDVLGRGTSCQVVENPALLGLMDHLSEKEKDEVRKILSSKHLFYEEMCSYHNGNRLHLPPDPALQRSLQLALRSRDDHENNDVKRHLQEDFDDDNQDAEMDDFDEVEENHALRGDNGGPCGVPLGSTKRMKQSQSHEYVSFENPSNSQDCIGSSQSHLHISHADMNKPFSEGAQATWLQNLRVYSLQLEEQRLQIQAEMLDLEKQRSEWQRFSRKYDCDLDKLRMENARIKIENENMDLELKQKELGADSFKMSAWP